jgi:hypothetical protein
MTIPIPTLLKSAQRKNGTLASQQQGTNERRSMNMLFFFAELSKSDYFLGLTVISFCDVKVYFNFSHLTILIIS